MSRQSLRILLLWVGVAAPLGACAPTDPSDGPATGESAFSEDAAADLDVPRFPKDSLAGRHNARMRVAYGEGPFEDFNEGDAHVVVALQPEAHPYTLWVNQGARGRLLVQFGRQSEPIRKGTYACADSDGRVRLAATEPPSSQESIACRIVVDEIFDRQLPGALRVHGRFEATTDPASPFGTDRVRGAFVADLPHAR